MLESAGTPSAAAQAAHKAFHDAWGGPGNNLDLYVTSPVWESVADAVRRTPQIAKPALWAALAEVWEDEPSAAEWDLAGLMASRAIEFFDAVATGGPSDA